MSRTCDPMSPTIALYLEAVAANDRRSAAIHRRAVQREHDEMFDPFATDDRIDINFRNRSRGHRRPVYDYEEGLY